MRSIKFRFEHIRVDGSVMGVDGLGLEDAVKTMRLAEALNREAYILDQDGGIVAWTL